MSLYVFVFQNGSWNNPGSRFSLETKLFLDPLDRGEGDIAELRHIPHTLTLP